MPVILSVSLSEGRSVPTLYPTLAFVIVAHRAIQSLWFDMALMLCDNMYMVGV